MPDVSMLSTDERSLRREFGWFMLIALAVLAAGIGLRDPWPPDEPRFALVARQMLESSQWLFPHRGMELYSDKPPMLMWTEAFWMWLTGGWRGAFLLTSLFSGLGTLALVWHLGRRLWNAHVGLVAAALVLATMQFVDVVKHAQIDPLNLFWITLGNTGILLHCLRGPNWRMYWLGCFAAGLGVITKGVGVIALLMLIPYAVMRARQWPGVTVTRGDGWRWAGGALAFLLAIALWLVPMLATAYGLRTPEYLAYVHDILFRQTAERYANSWQHEEKPWFFLLVILRQWIPTWLLVPFLVPRWRDALRLREPRVWMPLLWFVLVLVFFSIPRGKREIYILPALPMLALAMAPYVVDLLKTRWLPKVAFWITLGCAAVFGGAGLWALTKTPKVAQRIAEGYELPGHGHDLWVCVIAVGVGFLVSALVFRPRRGVAALLGGMALAWIIWPLGTYPLLDANQSTRQLMEEADAAIGTDGQLGLVAWREELLYQARRPVAEFGFARDSAAQLHDARAWQVADPAHRWLLINEEAFDDCIVADKVVPLGVANRSRFALLPAAASKPGCVPSPAVTK
ncbi:4-amino-4-deoxy-L-arabinose transferase-like glycosyltransferase [Luteibacter jiangsuensis]|uniref:4-amino-4-deoxy-L-arabinose transferase-like glycosyltransferase n=1 Tax=Luteibacter jiangsuensis TaxID=637577 RepID=A0ABT9SVV3_9GAMM|nr:glycosyltransferase family 39 protein [Luteibacter jiangsuensis]MDQ0009131.1 4-amino-4-deoxy-L-arabinose transferase-like glycosyltransferase [Luteibacter jiangsuensis]